MADEIESVGVEMRCPSCGRFLGSTDSVARFAPCRDCGVQTTVVVRRAVPASVARRAAEGRA